jgi:hypothetical protein
MKEKIAITIHNIDDVNSVLRSIELLFQKLINYYAKNNVQNLATLVLSCSIYFGRILRLLGYTEKDFEGLE